MQMLAEIPLDLEKEYEIVNGQTEEKEVAGARLQVAIRTEEDELTCEEILPGFGCRLREIFRSPAARPA